MQEFLDRLRALARDIRERFQAFVAGTSALPRLAYLVRREIPDALRPPPRSVLYETRLSIAPEECLEILADAGYYFELPFAGQIFSVRASAQAGEPRGVELSLIVESTSWPQSLILRVPRGRRAVEERLRNITARIVFMALTGQHRNHAFSSREYGTGHWLRELYPTLQPAGFQEIGWLPTGLWPLRKRHAGFEERLRHPLRRRRRILLLPMRARRADVERLIPPPFEPRWRNPTTVAGDHTELRLYLRIFLDGGPLYAGSAGRRSSYNIAEDAAGFPIPDLTRALPEQEDGEESGLYLELLCPALLHGDAVRARGWVPLLALRLPLNRPGLPWDALSASYRVRADGLRFCAGDGRRRLLGQAHYAPLRGMHRGEKPPRLVRVPTNIFIQSPETLDVHLFRESYTAPANRTYILRNLMTPGSTRPPAIDTYLAEKLGIQIQAEPRAWFISYADVATLSHRRVPLIDCHYRSPRPIVPDVAGRPVSVTTPASESS